MDKEERKRLKNRRIYITQRLRELKEEQKRLKAEGEELGTRLSEGRTAAAEEDDSDI